MPPTRNIWPKRSIVVWCAVLLLGILLALVAPPVRPLLWQSAWLLFVLPGAATAGQMPNYAKQFELPGDWNWTAWGYRLGGLALALIVVGGWWRAVLMSIDASGPMTLLTTVAPLVQVALIVPLFVALVAGNLDQRDENLTWARNFLDQFRR